MSVDTECRPELLAMLGSAIATCISDIPFDGKQLLCTTGTSLKIFTLDKQLDRVWDEMVRKFFRKNQVAFEDA